LIEACAEALLELGHPEVVGPELRALAEEHPFRERLWSLVAISQYQTLRQADALGTLRTLRERLADELGVDPSPQLRELELAVLNHAAGLAAPQRVALAAAPAGRAYLQLERPTTAEAIVGGSAGGSALAPFVAQMRSNLAGALGVKLDCVSVKAKRTEGLGFEGEGRGVAAYAIANILTNSDAASAEARA